MAELGAQLAGVGLRNPLILASGVLGLTTGTLARVAKSGAGAVTMKSICAKPRPGHPNPTVLEWECGIINAVGLANAGMDAGALEVAEAVKKVKVPVIASVFGADAEEFATVAEKLAAGKPAMIEANLSCPNVMGENGTPFSYEPEPAEKIVRAIKARVPGIPLIAKLSPNTHRLVEVAKAVESAGAGAINMGNALGPGMAISLEARRPILANKAGGVSGLAIKPVMVRCVWDVYEAVKIPIIGAGGVSSGRDALEFIMAGATCVGVGSALAWGGPKVFRKFADEMNEWLEANGIATSAELVGVAHG